MVKWKDNCQFCGKPIKVAIFRGTNYCSDNCRKDLKDIKLRGEK